MKLKFKSILLISSAFFVHDISFIGYPEKDLIQYYAINPITIEHYKKITKKL